MRAEATITGTSPGWRDIHRTIGVTRVVLWTLRLGARVRQRLAVPAVVFVAFATACGPVVTPAEHAEGGATNASGYRFVLEHPGESAGTADQLAQRLQALSEGQEVAYQDPDPIQERLVFEVQSSVVGRLNESRPGTLTVVASRLDVLAASGPVALVASRLDVLSTSEQPLQPHLNASKTQTPPGLADDHSIAGRGDSDGPGDVLAQSSPGSGQGRAVSLMTRPSDEDRGRLAQPALDGSQSPAASRAVSVSGGGIPAAVSSRDDGGGNDYEPAVQGNGRGSSAAANSNGNGNAQAPANQGNAQGTPFAGNSNGNGNAQAPANQGNAQGTPSAGNFNGNGNAQAPAGPGNAQHTPSAGTSDNGRTTRATRWPALSRAGTSAEPMRPVDPVTATSMPPPRR